jgi:uncharacterized glyoxalase superfamily protein PhnB
MNEFYMKLNRVTPIFRIFDETKAKEFYIEYLEFKLDWEHRFEADLPLYMQISKGNCQIHLSEHFGDGSPGAHIRIETENLMDYHRRLLEKKYKYSRPGLETTPWNTIEMCINDPFGNKITLYEEEKSKD